MAYTTTPNLGLRVDTTLSADSKYNLNRIDTLAATITRAVTDDVKVRGSTNIVLEPDCSDSGVGGSGGGLGNLTLGASSNKIATLKIYATSVDFDGTAPTKLGLANGSIWYGNSSGYATAADTASQGDVLASSAGLTYKALSVTGADIANSTITYGKLALSEDIVNADISTSAAIAWSKLDTSGSNLTDITTRSHTSLSDVGTNTHAQVDSHIADASIHFTEASIDHTAISNVGTNTHAQLDSHLASTANPHSVTKAQILAAEKIVNGDVDNSAGIVGTKIVPNFGYQTLIISSAAAKEFQLSAADVSTTYQLKVPATIGALGQILTISNTSTGALSWTTPAAPGVTVPQYNIVVGNSSDVGTVVDTNSVGDILADETNGLTYKALSIANADISNSAAIGWTKIDKTGSNLTDIATRSHTDLSNIGTNTHAQIDSHISETGTFHGVTHTGAHTLTVTTTNNTNVTLPTTGTLATLAGVEELSNKTLVAPVLKTTVPGSPVEGQMWWDSTDHTIALQTGRSDVVQQVGQELHIYVFNDSGALIENGSVVYIYSANTARPTVRKARADIAATSDATIGFATCDLEASGANRFGYVTTFGYVRGLTTNVDKETPPNAVVDGDAIYLSATTAGGWTKVAPTAPYHTIRIGHVVNAAAGAAGTILVDVNLGAHLGGLHDVYISSVNGLDLLTYDGGNTRWKNIATGTANQVFGLNAAGTAYEFKTLQGTANRASVTHGANTVTVNVDATQWPSSTAAGDTLPLTSSLSANTATWSLPAALTDNNNSGFVSWGSEAANYYSFDASTGVFTVLRSVVGRIKGAKKTLAANATTTLTRGKGYAIVLNTSNALEALEWRTAVYNADTKTYMDNMETFFKNYVVLFTIFYDALDQSYQVIKQPHPYDYGSEVCAHDHFRLGHVFIGSGGLISVLSAANRTIQTTGNAALDDHGLITAVADGTGVAMSTNCLYQNASGTLSTLNRRAFVTSVGTPVAGDVYRDSGDTFRVTVLHFTAGVTHAYQSAGTATPPNTTTSLTLVSGSGSASITYTSWTEIRVVPSIFVPQSSTTIDGVAYNKVPAPLATGSNTNRWGICAIYATADDLQTPSTASPLPKYIVVPSSVAYSGANANTAIASLGTAAIPDTSQFLLPVEIEALEPCLMGFVLIDGNSRAIPATTSSGFVAGVRSYRNTGAGTGGAGAATVTNAVNVSTDTSTFNGRLSTADVNVQLALQTLDDNVTSPALGGTGVANNAASTLTISGNYATTLTVSNTTSVTLPTSGTLATLAGAETLTNKELGANTTLDSETASISSNLLTMTSNKPMQRITSGTALKGIAKSGPATPVDGEVVTIVNETGAILVIGNDATVTDAYRIFTGTGSDINLGVNAALNLVYDAGIDGAVGKWVVAGGSGGGLTPELSSAGTITCASGKHYLVDCSAADRHADLPDGATGGKVRFSTFGNGATAYRLTIDASLGSDKIDYFGTDYDDVQLLPACGWCELTWDGTKWRVDDQAQFVSGTFAGDCTFTGAVVSDSPTFVVDKTNHRVGIGTASPGGKVDIRDGTLIFTDTDVAHGMTGFSTTETFLKISPLSGTAGGAHVVGLSDTDATGLSLTGVIGSTDPTDTTPAVSIVGTKKNTTADQALGAAETVFQITNYTTPIMTGLGSGNVGIGTASPAAPLHVVGTNGIIIKADPSDTVSGSRFYGSGANSFYFASTATTGYFVTNCGGGATPGNGTIATIYNGSTARGSITVDNSGTQYVTTSDARMKEDPQDFSALGIISLVKPYDFKWKDSGERSKGMYAQELHEVYPQAVVAGTPENDQWGIDYSKLVPVLTKAIQELSAKNDALEARLAALEAKGQS